MPDAVDVVQAERCSECGARPEPPEAAGEPVTHCEWCGAEYPVPSGR